MEPSQLTALLDAQKQLLQAAKARKGQRATNKPSREQLLFQHGIQLEGNFSDKYAIKTCQINHAYPPSTTPMVDLKPITLSQLRLETHHIGRVLVIRTITQSARIQAVHSLIEDEDGEVDVLAVYNADFTAAPDDVLPPNTALAIKEPFYKASASGAGGYLVRVDHPSDIVRLRASHPMVPVNLMPPLLELDEDAQEYKAVGNANIKDKKYLASLEAYSLGIAVCGEADDAVRRDLSRNRALVNTYLHRYETAYDDAVAAFDPSAEIDEDVKKNNTKAFYRAGRAAYCLERFSDAKGQYEQLLKLSPGDKYGIEEMAKTNARLKESTNGDYDFPTMSDRAASGHKRLDHASFTKNVVVGAAGSKGRGLFATKAVKAGELVLVEKAFSVSYNSEQGKEIYIIMNLNDNTVRMGPHAMMYYRLVQKMSHNPSQADQVLDLFSGGYSPVCKAEMVDGNVVIDTFRVAAIMGRNCFGCPETSTADHLRHGKAEDAITDAVGMWVMASYCNHTCDANANRSFIGDMMIVRATKDVKKGEEIFLSYRAEDWDNYDTQAALQKTWGFSCECRMCTAEAATPEPRRKARSALIKEVRAFLDMHSQVSLYLGNPSVIAKAEDLYTKLDRTYDKNSLASVPRIALAHVGHWLCGVTQTQKSIHKVIDVANRALRELGYGVEVKAKNVLIDPTHACFQPVVVDIVMYAAHGCYLTRNVALGKQYEEFARKQYLILCGQMKGFEEKYGQSGHL